MSDPYDPSETEDRRRGSQYVSRKDFKVIAVVLVVLGALAYPVYIYMLRQVNSSTCNKNLRKIASAMSNYITDADDHLPFAYETNGYDSTDINLRGTYAFTWQWQLQRYTGEWSAFHCPSAAEGEDSKTSDGSTIHESSYGMLNGYSGVSESTLVSPDQKILIGETAKSGASDTYDPMPLKIGGTILKEDGFVIGFDNDQNYPNSSTKFATRLAFLHSGKPDFGHEVAGRHPEGLHFVTVGGILRAGDASIGEIIPYGGGFGPWDVPKPAPPVARKPLRP